MSSLKRHVFISLLFSKMFLKTLHYYNHLSNYTKTIIRLRLVSIPLDFVSGNIHQYSLRLCRIIVKYSGASILLRARELAKYGYITRLHYIRGFHIIYFLHTGAKNAVRYSEDVVKQL